MSEAVCLQCSHLIGVLQLCNNNIVSVWYILNKLHTFQPYKFDIQNEGGSVILICGAGKQQVFYLC